MRALSMNQALTTILECFNEAEKMKAHALAAIVLDAGGRVKAFLKQDGASVMRFEIARTPTNTAPTRYAICRSNG